MAIYKLGEVAKIQNGRTPSTKNNLLWKKEIPFYGPGDLIDMKIKRFISKDLKMIKRKGTVLFSSTATIGNVGIINQDSWFNQQITSIEANNEIILDKYLFYYMKKISPNIVKKTKGMGTVFPIISINFFKKLEV
uniref:restriction endonuclease subunit S n=1 Tax=[Mycoplasma] collis TaxID=2127 RepID=UPI00051BB39D